MVFVTFFVSMTTMLCKDIVTGNAERRVTILYERGYISTPLFLAMPGGFQIVRSNRPLLPQKAINH